MHACMLLLTIIKRLVDKDAGSSKSKSSVGKAVENGGHGERQLQADDDQYGGAGIEAR